MTRVIWAIPARDDLARIDDFYRPVAPDFAEKLGRAALAASRFLADHREAGPVMSGSVRKWRVQTFDYVLLYRATENGVEILRMHHVREGWRTL
jgi:plasmid stabilization system protein ParE